MAREQSVVLSDSTFYVDVVFRHLRLVIEIDGRLYHTGAEAFEADSGDGTFSFWKAGVCCASPGR